LISKVFIVAPSLIYFFLLIPQIAKSVPQIMAVIIIPFIFCPPTVF